MLARSAVSKTPRDRTWIERCLGMRSHLATVRWEIWKSRDSGYPRGHLKLRGSRGRGVGERASSYLSNAVEGVTNGAFQRYGSDSVSVGGGAAQAVYCLDVSISKGGGGRIS